MYDVETLYFSIYKYMETYFPVPPLNEYNWDLVEQIMAQREAIMEFLSMIFDNPDMSPSRLLMEYMLKLEKKAYDRTEDGYLLLSAFQALEDIEADFFLCPAED